VRYSLLIVDDSRTMRKIILRSLRQAGVDIGEFFQAGSGTEGLEVLEHAEVDLVLADVHMPKLSGLDFICAVQDQCPNPPPIVMISSDRHESVVDEAINRGAKGFLQKPFTVDSIRKVLGPLLMSVDSSAKGRS